MFIHLLLLFSWPFLEFLQATSNIITTSQFLQDPKTLISPNKNYILGFFSPSNSTDRYVGIWFNTPDSDALQVVWVANRNNPLNDTSGVLKISVDGNLQLLNSQNTSFFSSNLRKTSITTNYVAKLLDSGNLVLLTNNSTLATIIWQSFDYPTDTIIPPRKFAFSREKNPFLWAWKSLSDPSIGRFKTGIYRRNLTELFIWEDEKPYWRSGPWNGNTILGVFPSMSTTSLFGFTTYSEDNEITFYLTYSVTNGSAKERVVLEYDGNFVATTFDDGNTGKWTIGWQSYQSECDEFGKCGDFGRCNKMNSPICDCLDGFEPKNKEEWKNGDWRNGCVRIKALQCGNLMGGMDGFLRLEHMKVPDNAQWLTAQDKNDCRRKCFKVCSCLAYAYYFGIGCMVWNESLIDIQQYPYAGADLFIRLADSELATRKWNIIIEAMVIVIVVTIIIGAGLYFVGWRYRKYARRRVASKDILFHIIEASGRSDIEFQDFPLFQFEKLVAATNNFDVNNKLGQGGFGLVYKGKLENGQEIAVKRLSTASNQGQQEFVNEVVVILKLQHKNLVKLLGCCVEGEEKLLVYEFMPNKSLATILFDPVQTKLLDWKKRFEIIKGICRGILYLHRDSRMKIIHRDLKAGNILLDEEFNPKISDFGMARIFGGKQDQATTIRVVGTYGYMSPEYAMEGRFSEKSDIYSLGVLVLEIVSGRKKGGFHDGCLSLLSYAWRLLNEDNLISLVDRTIYDPIFEKDLLRSLNIGLLCVQEIPEDRPNISSVLSMIESEVMIQLPKTLRIGFTQSRVSSVNDHGIHANQQNGEQNGSINLVSLSSTMDGR